LFNREMFKNLFEILRKNICYVLDCYFFYSRKSILIFETYIYKGIYTIVND